LPDARADRLGIPKQTLDCRVPKIESSQIETCALQMERRSLSSRRGFHRLAQEAFAADHPMCSATMTPAVFGSARLGYQALERPEEGS
jgi:hypothetical protein